MAKTCNQSLGAIWPSDVWFVVGQPGALLSAGGQVFTLPSSFKGWLIRINRNSGPLDYLDQGTGDPYFTYDSSGAIVTVSVDVNDGEKFQIMAYKPAS